MTLCGPAQSRIVREPVVRIHNRVSEIVEDSSMPVIRARARGEQYLPAGLPPKLRRKRRRLNPEFLKVIDGNQAARSAQRAECLRLAES